MIDEAWKDEYREWKTLKPFQVKLLEEGAQSLSQAWLVNTMWCDWKEIKKLKETQLPSLDSPINSLSEDPWGK